MGVSWVVKEMVEPVRLVLSSSMLDSWAMAETAKNAQLTHRSAMRLAEMSRITTDLVRCEVRRT